MSDPRVNGHKPPNDHRLPDQMPDDLPESGGYADVRVYLNRWQAPAAVHRAAAHAQLLAALQEEALSELRRSEPQPETALRRRSVRHAWLILSAQTRVIHKLLWAASALVIALGALVTLAFRMQDGSTLPLTIVAPIVAAFGVAFLYGVDADPAVELILATPVSPRLIVLARLALVFGFNLLVAGICSVALALMKSDFSLLGLVLDWLAPMTLLSGFAFLLSALLFDPLASGLISLCVWFAVVGRHFDILLGSNLLHLLPDLLRADFHVPMLAAGLVIFALAFARIQSEERWMRQAA